MCVQLPSQQTAVNDDVASFGETMVACESHVPSEQVVFCKPPVDCLSSTVAVGFAGRFHDASRTEKSAIDEGMMACMDVSASLSISRPASKESMSFRNNRFVVVKCCLKPNGTTTEFGMGLAMVDCVLFSSASDHGSRINERSDIIDVVVLPVA